LALGPTAVNYLDYFENARRKRNDIDYDRAVVATDTEAAEMVTKARAFLESVERWIQARDPKLAKCLPRIKGPSGGS
jgi:hypothetical protein